jgi:hypothetical protein
VSERVPSRGTGPALDPDMKVNRRLGIAYAATIAMVVLAATASLAGVLVPGLYAEDVLAAAMRGQDLATLIALPFLIVALHRMKRGSPRATVVWIGLLGYLLYTYAGAAFAYRFNRLFLVYVTLFSLSVVSLWAAATGIDAAEVQRRLGGAAPRRAAAVFAVAIAIMLGVSELGQIVPALAAGRVPDLIARSQGAGNFVYVLDLGIVAPLAVLAAVWLWHGSAWGDVLGGCILIKATTMGFALLAMTWFAVRAGQPLEAGLTIAYGAMAVGSLVMSVWLLRPRTARPIARSARLDAWLPDAPFRDTIVVESPAPAPRLMQALEEVTLRDMPFANLLGKIRYLPALFGSKKAARQAQLELDRPFIAGVASGKGQLFLSRAPDELVLGTVGKLHQIRDQEFAEVPTTADFAAFAQPNHERLAMSIRAIPGDHGTLLALEHRTQPTDAAARRRFARYWLAIRPGGAFVTRQLLKAVARRAERTAGASATPAQLSN